MALNTSQIDLDDDMETLDKDSGTSSFFDPNKGGGARRKTNLAHRDE